MGVSHDSLSAALEHAKHERRELCSISALHRGSRSECLQAAFRDVKPTQAQPSALSPQPSPSLLASERAHQAPAVSPPQPPHRCWSLAGTSVKQGWPLRAACLCCWCQCASESACVQASMCECKRVSKGCSNHSFGLLPEAKTYSLHTHALGFLLTLAPRCFVKPQPHLTQQLNCLEARSWKRPCSSAVFTSSTRCFPSAQRCHLLMPFLLFPLGSCSCQPTQTHAHEKPSLLIHLPWVLRKINFQLLFSENGVGTVYSVR